MKILLTIFKQCYLAYAQCLFPARPVGKLVISRLVAKIVIGSFVFVFTICAHTAPLTISPAKIPIKVVVVTMFESGEPTGDKPGELQLWVERGQLTSTLDFPLGEHPLFTDSKGVLAICVGGGIANATASIMALGLDQRFDLSKSYWLVAGSGYCRWRSTRFISRLSRLGQPRCRWRFSV